MLIKLFIEKQWKTIHSNLHLTARRIMLFDEQVTPFVIGVCSKYIFEVDYQCDRNICKFVDIIFYVYIPVRTCYLFSLILAHLCTCESRQRKRITISPYLLLFSLILQSEQITSYTLLLHVYSYIYILSFLPIIFFHLLFLLARKDDLDPLEDCSKMNTWPSCDVMFIR